MPLCSCSQIALEHISRAAVAKRIVFVSGNFNIIHPGHLRLLRFAKECGDYLVTGVQSAKFKGAYLPEDLRLESVQAINWVDYSFILHDPPEDFIGELKPTIVVKGSEHEQMYNPEVEALAQYGGKLLFGSGDISFSSVDLMRQEWRDLNTSTIRKPHDYLSRHAIDSDEILKILRRMKKLKICVIGDTIVDEYISCDALGMSQEDPTIVVTPVMQEKFVGGAGIVAAHAHSLGSSVHFFSVLGPDETSRFVCSKIGAYGIDFHRYEDESRPTTLKQRFRVARQTLLRVSHLRQHDISSDIRARILADILEVLDDTDLLIFADFNYGCLPQSLVTEIVAQCKKRGVMMAADSQSSSQIGDVSRFRDMTLATPTEREARLALQDFDSGLVVLAEKLKEKACFENVILTLGAEGVLIHAGLSDRNKWPTDRLSALNLAPKDVAGAGDSLLTCASMALAAGADIWQASYLGALAAACQVGRVGNLPLTHDELIAEIADEGPASCGRTGDPTSSHYGYHPQMPGPDPRKTITGVLAATPHKGGNGTPSSESRLHGG
ncbi:MAG: PfkB family carbohydrate kinase [Syntrophobacteraceae bacterium]